MPTDKALPLLGMVLVTHGRLAEEMVTAMEHVVGPQRAVATVCIGPNDNMEVRRGEIAEAIQRVDEGRGVVMLTDLFGGTPSNLAISLLESARKTMDLRAAVIAAKEAGQKYISVASEMLGVGP